MFFPKLKVTVYIISLKSVYGWLNFLKDLSSHRSINTDHRHSPIIPFVCRDTESEVGRSLAGWLKIKKLLAIEARGEKKHSIRDKALPSVN